MVANVVGWGMEMLGKGGELVGVMMGVSWRFFAGLVCQSGCSGWACVCLNEPRFTQPFIIFPIFIPSHPNLPFALFFPVLTHLSLSA